MTSKQKGPQPKQQLQAQQQQQQQQNQRMRMQQLDYGDEEGMMDTQEEEEIIFTILELGNDILACLGVEEIIEDVGVFFNDQFYLQFFQAAFPDFDFSKVEPGQSEEEVAENIQFLIDFLGQQVFKVDLSALSGLEIVCGNPEHCIRLLQLIQDITVLMAEEEGDDPSDASPGQAPLQQDAREKKGLGYEMVYEEDEEERKLMEEIKQIQGKRPPEERQELRDEDFDDDDYYEEDGFDDEEGRDEPIKPKLEEKAAGEQKAVDVSNTSGLPAKMSDSQQVSQKSEDRSSDVQPAKTEEQKSEKSQSVASLKKSEDEDFKDYDEELDEYGDEEEPKPKIVFPQAQIPLPIQEQKVQTHQKQNEDVKEVDSDDSINEEIEDGSSQEPENQSLLKKQEQPEQVPEVKRSIFPLTKPQFPLMNQPSQNMVDAYSYDVDMTKPQKTNFKSEVTQVSNDKKIHKQPSPKLSIQKTVLATEIKNPIQKGSKGNKSIVDQSLNSLQGDQFFIEIKQKQEQKPSQDKVSIDTMSAKEKQKLLSFLEKEYDRDPSQFPFPKYALSEFLMGPQQNTRIQEEVLNQPLNESKVSYDNKQNISTKNPKYDKAALGRKGSESTQKHETDQSQILTSKYSPPHQKQRRPRSAKPRSNKPAALEVKLPKQSQDLYNEQIKHRPVNASAHRQKKRPSSSKQPKLAKRKQSVNPMLRYIEGFSQRPVDKPSKKAVPLVDEGQLMLMTREELSELLKRQQEFIKQNKLSPKKKKKQRQNKDLRSTITSFSSKKPVKAVHAQQQPQTQINNFFLNVANPADASNIMSNQVSFGLGAGVSQTNLTNIKPTPQQSIPQDAGYQQLTDDEFMRLLQSNQIQALTENPSLKAFLEQKVLENNPNIDFYTEVYKVLQGGILKTQHRMDYPVTLPRYADPDVQRIERQKKELDLLMKKYRIADKSQAQGKKQKWETHDEKMQRIQEMKFREELMREQAKHDYHRQNQNMKLTEKIYSMATKIEKNRFVHEKQEHREKEKQSQEAAKKMLESIETYYGDKVKMLKEKIKNEKFEKQIASQAQKEVLDKVRRQTHKKTNF